MVKYLLSFSLLSLAAGCATGTSKDDTKVKDDTSTAPCDGCGDEDSDGYSPSEGDCDDGNPDVNPSATETCNGNDDDCDDQIDEDVQNTFYEDFDEDGFGDADSTTTSCDQPDGYVQNGTDCDDNEPDAYPGATEICDEIDNNCDGNVDEGVTNTYYADADGDTYGDPNAGSEACELPEGYVEDNTDCDDTTDNAYPGNAEVCDEVDNNCDGTVDEGVTTTYYADFDGDRYGNADLTQEACAVPSGYTNNADDCDDGEAAVNPAATEVCNAIDDDCDGNIDDTATDRSTWYADVDGDSYGDAASTTLSCTQPAGYVADATDCDDGRALTNPGATEYCNTYDDDCDGTVDEDDSADAPTWYLDADTDGYGNASITDVQCSQPSGYVSDNTDCLDTSDITYPGADEICDSIDNDCDGTVDEDPIDGNTYYADTDKDGFGDPSNTDMECAVPSGYVENSWDCDDGDRTEPVVADPVSGSASGTGSISDPYDSLQDAIDAAFLCVVAYSGTYREQIVMDDSKNIDVWGVEGYDVTIIDPSLTTCTTSNPTDCGSAFSVTSNAGATPTIHGFTITGGTGSYEYTSSTETCADSSASHTGRTTCTVEIYEYYGGGIFVNGDDPVFYDVDVRDNTLPEFQQVATGSFTQTWLYSYGGGVALRNSNASFSSSYIAGNYADQGGGVYAHAGSNFMMEQTVVGENDAEDGAGVNLDGASAQFSNAIVDCNDAGTDGGGLFTESSGTASFVNTVLYGNTSSTSGTARGSQAYIGASTTFDMMNSVVEATTTVDLLYGAGGSGTLDYNNVYNG